MIQKDMSIDNPTLAVPAPYPLSDLSLRDTITATIIREEAAESLLLAIQGDAELVALTQVLNRYDAQWWLKHLSSVGADPARYWREQLGAEIKVATRGQHCTSQKKKFIRWSFRGFMKRRTYELYHLDLIPL